MADQTAYFAEKKSITKQLDVKHPEGWLHVTSLSNPATGSTEGTVTQVSTALAAVAFIAKNARESTPEEIQAHQVRGKSLQALTNAVTQRENKQVIQVLESK